MPDYHSKETETATSTPLITSMPISHASLSSPATHGKAVSTAKINPHQNEETETAASTTLVTATPIISNALAFPDSRHHVPSLG